MKTKAVRLYGVNDLRLEEFDLPEIKDDEGGSGTWTAEANYTWKNGNLMQAKIEYKENYKEGDGESWSWSFTDDYTYTYGTQVNFSKQFPYYMDDQITFFEDNIGGFFNVIGLFCLICFFF